MRGFNRLSIQSKLMTMLLAVSIGSIAVIAYEGYRSGRSAIRDSVVERLVSVRTSKANQIEEYFRGLRGEMTVLGNSLSTIDALKALSAAFDTVLEKSQPIDGNRVSGLRRYYKEEFVPRLAENTGQVVNSDTFLPNSILARYLQYEYLVNNDNPIGEKQALDDADDGSQYSELHAKYHPIFRDIVKEFGYYDLFLINNKGDIVYSVFKESDFATSLLLGPYARSGLADAYRDAQKQNSGYVAITDFTFYAPSYGAPAAFMATPIYDGTVLIGVLAIQVPIDEVNSVMTDNGQWRQSGLGETGETFLVGEDKTLRSDSRTLIESPEVYIEALRSLGASQEELAQVAAMQTSVLNQTAVSDAIEKAFEGKSGVKTVANYLGDRVISAYAPLDIRGVDWVLVAEINENEIFQPISAFAQRVLIAAVALVLLITLASLWLARSFLKPVHLLGEGFQRLSKGYKEVSVPVLADDELGALAKSFNHMVKKNRKTNELVFRKTQETESLLLNMFPESVAKRLKRGKTQITDTADSVTVLFANVLNFQQLTQDLKPKKAIKILNEIVSALDDLTDTHGIEKIKTTGSEYLAVSGLSVARLDHAKRMIDFAIEAIRIVSQVNREHSIDLKMRVGIHTGSVMAGTVGSQRLIYDVWGETVVTAHYVQSAAPPNSILVSKAVANSLLDLYEFESEGEIAVRSGEKVAIFQVNI